MEYKTGVDLGGSIDISNLNITKIRLTPLEYTSKGVLLSIRLMHRYGTKREDVDYFYTKRFYEYPLKAVDIANDFGKPYSDCIECEYDTEFTIVKPTRAYIEKVRDKYLVIPIKDKYAHKDFREMEIVDSLSDVDIIRPTVILSPEDYYKEILDTYHTVYEATHGDGTVFIGDDKSVSLITGLSLAELKAMDIQQGLLERWRVKRVTNVLEYLESRPIEPLDAPTLMLPDWGRRPSWYVPPK